MQRVLLILLLLAGISPNYAFAQRSGSSNSSSSSSSAASRGSSSNYSPSQNNSSRTASVNTSSRRVNTNSSAKASNPLQAAVNKSSAYLKPVQNNSKTQITANLKPRLENSAAKEANRETRSHRLRRSREIAANASNIIVYICANKSSTEYHRTSSCSELMNCRGNIKAITEEKAIKMGMHKCPVCW